MSWTGPPALSLVPRREPAGSETGNAALAEGTEGPISG